MVVMIRRVAGIWRSEAMKKNTFKKSVQAKYAEMASTDGASRESHKRLQESARYAASIGYSARELESVPEGAVVTHGCGNPTALAELTEGETVLDLGCGGGLDAFLASQKVGPKGRVIGVDMTAEMVERAKANAKAGNYANIDLKLGEIDRLPLPDSSVDVVISNCVINHAPDKLAVFKEAYRVLKPNGRIYVSDLVTAGKLSEETVRDADKLWAEWLAVASDRREYLNAIKAAGFRELTVMTEGTFPKAEADAGLRRKIINIQVKGSK
jgi:SAM-dependent methyltransferase